MDDDLTALAAETKAFLKKRLRERFRYMKQAALDAATEKAVKTLQIAVEENMPEMDATKSRVSFLSLSAELRNRIYEEVLQLNEKKKTLIFGASSDDVYEQPDIPAIAQVSQQVRSETMAMHYSDKFFVFPIFRNGESEQLKTWLKTIGPQQAAMVKHLRFEAKFSRRDLKRMVKNALKHLEVTHRDWFIKEWGLDLLARTCITIDFENAADGVLEFNSNGALRVSEYDEVEVLYWKRDDESEWSSSS